LDEPLIGRLTNYIDIMFSQNDFRKQIIAQKKIKNVEYYLFKKNAVSMNCDQGAR